MTACLWCGRQRRNVKLRWFCTLRCGYQAAVLEMEKREAVLS